MILLVPSSPASVLVLTWVYPEIVGAFGTPLVTLFATATNIRLLAAGVTDAVANEVFVTPVPLVRFVPTTPLGAADGLIDGDRLGDSDGLRDGDVLGEIDGLIDLLGLTDGLMLGDNDGDRDGLRLGDIDGENDPAAYSTIAASA